MLKTADGGGSGIALLQQLDVLRSAAMNQDQGLVQLHHFQKVLPELSGARPDHQGMQQAHGTHPHHENHG